MSASCSIALCRLHDVPDGRSRGFDPGGAGRDTIFVVRLGEMLHAYRDACPHHGGTPMAWRKDAYLNGDGTRIACHAHGAQFDIGTGVCVLGPCLGQTLEPVRVEVATDGTVILMQDNKETPQ
ncbi:Rieske (2Fe-2S) protein [Burkholderia cenocepacia]|nr:Rieske (2Fe-2S) protein [Burkholderia cenocepacia]